MKYFIRVCLIQLFIQLKADLFIILFHIFLAMSFHTHLKWAPQKGKTYKILSGLSDKMALDVSQNPNEMHKLIIYQYGGGSNQKFHFEPVDGNRFLIHSAKDNKVLHMEGGTGDNNGRLVAGNHEKKVSQYFELIHANFHNKNNAFYIKTWSGRALDVAGGNCKNEQRIIQWDYNGQHNQIWIIEEA